MASFLSLAGAATSIICRDKHLFRDKHVFVATKHVFMFVATKYFCRDETFVPTNICRVKHTFAATSIVLSRQKKFFVATKVNLSRQNYVCRDKHSFQRSCGLWCDDRVQSGREDFGVTIESSEVVRSLL